MLARPAGQACAAGLARRPAAAQGGPSGRDGRPGTEGAGEDAGNVIQVLHTHILTLSDTRARAHTHTHTR